MTNQYRDEYRIRELENIVVSLAEQLEATNERILGCYKAMTEMQKQINELARVVYK